MSDPDDADANHGHGTRAVIAAFLANVIIAVAKFGGFLVTRSSSMLAESIHSVADSGNQLLLLLGGRRARRSADADHPFGYGRERYFWAFVVALVLFVLGALFSIFEGLSKIRHPHELDRPEWALGILAFAAIAEGLSLRTAVREARKIKGEASFWRFIRRAKSPELPIVLLEDFGAMVGLLLAAAGISASLITDDAIWDGYATLGIGVLLGLIAMILVVEMKSLLIGESAARKDVEAIRAAIEIDPTVVKLIHLRTEHIGPDDLLTGAKVEFQHQMTMPEVSAAIDRIESVIRGALPAARMIFIEPDIDKAHKIETSYVPDLVGSIDPDDPDYEAITGQVPIVSIDDGLPPPPPATHETAVDASSIDIDDDDIWS